MIKKVLKKKTAKKTAKGKKGGCCAGRGGYGGSGHITQAIDRLSGIGNDLDRYVGDLECEVDEIRYAIEELSFVVDDLVNLCLARELNKQEIKATAKEVATELKATLKQIQ